MMDISSVSLVSRSSDFHGFPPSCIYFSLARPGWHVWYIITQYRGYTHAHPLHTLLILLLYSSHDIMQDSVGHLMEPKILGPIGLQADTGVLHVFRRLCTGQHGIS